MKLLKSLYILLFISGINLIALYFIFFTKYVPDFYVFIQYAFKDSARNLDIFSIISNVFLFDLFVQIGDYLAFDDFTQWIYLWSGLTVLTLSLKYYILFNSGRIYKVFIVYFASFFVDLNQLRFNFAFILLGIAVFYRKIWFSKILIIISSLSHVMPFLFYSIAKLRKMNMKYFICLLSILLIVILLGNYSLVANSRLFDYIKIGNGNQLPKVLILFFPSLFYIINSNFKSELFYIAKSFTFTILMSGLIIFPFNFEVSARLFEFSFIFVTIMNVYYHYSYKFDFIIFFLAVAVLLSRITNGINTASDFIEIYQ